MHSKDVEEKSVTKWLFPDVCDGTCCHGDEMPSYCEKKNYIGGPDMALLCTSSVFKLNLFVFLFSYSLCALYKYISYALTKTALKILVKFLHPNIFINME